jgi:hypothetical protein
MIIAAVDQGYFHRRSLQTPRRAQAAKSPTYDDYTVCVRHVIRPFHNAVNEPKNGYCEGPHRT